MIGYLKGQIIDQDTKNVILDVSGVGYKIFTNVSGLNIVPERSAGKGQSEAQATKEFWIHTAVRETSIDLYGFSTKEELSFFELLITVSGIGPKSALGILSVASLPNLRHAITTGDTSLLTKVSGIGRKNAEKIVVELRDKIEKVVAGLSESAAGDIDALEALKAIGFAERDAREALKKVTDSKDTGDKVKKALKLLS